MTVRKALEKKVFGLSDEKVASMRLELVGKLATEKNPMIKSSIANAIRVIEAIEKKRATGWVG